MKTILKSNLIIILSILFLVGCSSLAPQAIPATQTVPPTPVVPTPGSNLVTPLPDLGGLTITLADNGKTFNMKVGESFLLKLGYDYDWTIAITDETVLSRVKNIMVINGAQGVYQALKVGTTEMSVTGDPACRASNPPCMAPSILFTVTFVIS